MRKSYIGWWIASAYAFFGCCYEVYDYLVIQPTYTSVASPLIGFLFVVSVVFLYIGYRRFQEYKEYQEDRRIRNEYYLSNTDKSRLTPEIKAEKTEVPKVKQPGMVVQVRHSQENKENE